jgi:2-amino-4-hydroxy-6-hydroxymethyldihydropteridine diphosphokinase
LTRFFLGLGSNLGDRAAYLERALSALKAPDLQIVRVSPVYETAPVGLTDQPAFLNAVAEGLTSISAERLLHRCDCVEQAFKRRRDIPNGPRTIDIDILLYGDESIRSSELDVPHPRYRERRFVLQPLADLEPGLRDPETQRTVEEMLAETTDQVVRRTHITLAFES